MGHVERCVFPRRKFTFDNYGLFHLLKHTESLIPLSPINIIIDIVFRLVNILNIFIILHMGQVGPAVSPMPLPDR